MAKALSSVIEMSFVLVALLTPPVAIARLLGYSSTPLPDDLVRGVLLLKATLALLSIAVLIAGFLPVWAPSLTENTSHSNSQTRMVLGVLAVIIAMGAALRIYQLNAGLWHDEILTHVLYMHMPFGEILTTFDSENQHFLYTLLARASIVLFGDTPAALRLPAVLFGIGSLWALYLFANEVVGARLALLATTLMAVSYTHIWFSQNARGYSGLLFWTLLSSWFLLRGVRESGGRPWLGYAVTAALGLYTHFTMIFVLVGQFAVYGLLLILRRKQAWPKRWVGLFLGFGIGGLLALVLYALVLPQLLHGMGQETSLVVEWKSPLWTALEVVKGLEIGFKGWVAAATAGVVFLVGLVGLLRHRWEVAWLTIVPALVGAVVVVGLGHHLWPRFFFFAIGFGALVAIYGTDRLGQTAARWTRQSEQRQIVAGTVVCLALIVVAASTVPTAYGPKQDFEGALQFVNANQAPGDEVVTAGLATFTYQRYYDMGWNEVTTPAQLAATRGPAARIWLVYTFPTVLRSTAPELLDFVQREFQVVKVFRGTVGDGDIVVARWDRPGPVLGSR